MLNFASAAPESLLMWIGKVYAPRPMTIKSRKELLETIRPTQRRFLREDTGDLPEMPPAAATRKVWLAAAT